CFFFFQAEDGIRDFHVTGVQTCALPIFVVLAVAGVWAYQTANRLDRLHVRYDLSWQALDAALARRAVVARAVAIEAYGAGPQAQIGRASGRERGEGRGGGGAGERRENAA